jgi:serine/threonine protein phosphatase PrpC
MKFHWWAKTDVGKVRDENQDSWSVVPKYNLYMVADGMGGHATRYSKNLPIPRN